MRYYIAAYCCKKDNNIFYGLISHIAEDKGNALLKMTEILVKEHPNYHVEVNFKQMLSFPLDVKDLERVE